MKGIKNTEIKELINAIAGSLGGVIELKKLGYTNREIQRAYDLIDNRENSISDTDIKEIIKK